MIMEESTDEETQIIVPRIPRKTIVGIVRSFLQKYYDEDKLHELKFDDVNLVVKTAFPQSKFNPYHLAHYKHKFLLKMGEIKFYKGRK